MAVTELDERFGVRCISVDGDTLYNVNQLVEECGYRKAKDFISRISKLFGQAGAAEPYAAARLCNVRVGNVVYKAVNLFGLHALLLELHSRGEGNVQGMASFMGFELDAAAAAETGVEEEEDEEKASEGSEEAPDTEGGGTDAAETPEGSEEEGAPVRRDDRQKPPRPTSTALSRVLDSMAWGARKARRAIMARMKAAGGEQPIVPMVVFWREAAKGAPAIAFSVNGRDGVISVPPEGGLMLQVYRAANNLLRDEDLGKAKRRCRAYLEAGFHFEGRKFTGSLLHLTLFDIEHGTSMAAIKLRYDTTGMGVAYRTAMDQQRLDSETHLSTTWNKARSAKDDEGMVFSADNYWAKGQPAAPRRCGARGRSPAREGNTVTRTKVTAVADEASELNFPKG